MLPGNAIVPIAVGQLAAHAAEPTSTQVPAAVFVWNFLRYSLFKFVVETIA